MFLILIEIFKSFMGCCLCFFQTSSNSHLTRDIMTVCASIIDYCSLSYDVSWCYAPSYFPSSARELFSSWEYCNCLFPIFPNVGKHHMLMIIKSQEIINFVRNDKYMRIVFKNGRDLFKFSSCEYFTCWIMRSIEYDKSCFVIQSCLEWIYIKFELMLNKNERNSLNLCSSKLDMR